MNIRQREITTDEALLRQTAERLAEQSDGLAADCRSFSACISELTAFWEGEAERQYIASLSDDTEELFALSEVCKKLAEDYSFAADEYERNARRTEELVSALHI